MRAQAEAASAPLPARRPTGRALAAVCVAWGTLAGSALACSVDRAEFHSRLFACDPTAANSLCGTDARGQRMTCYAGTQIGASNFCADRCDEAMSLPDEDAVCVSGHAKLRACDPTDTGDPDHPYGACGHPDLGCLRTDVTSDEGVCITMAPCDDDLDCRDPVRSACATTFLAEVYAGHPGLKADHLYCLQAGCETGHANCSAGETCLRTVIPARSNPPDICVPNCNSRLECPPNHFCYRQHSGPAAPAVCIPGLLGFICATSIDCLVGECLPDSPSGTGLNLCTVRCATDDECSRFDGDQGQFFCSDDGRCVTPNAYVGPICNTDDDCTRDAGSVCVQLGGAPDEATGTFGTCLLPCAADLSCAPVGGVGHTCLPGLTPASATVPVCFPGLFGTPCLTDASCIEGLTCQGADISGAAPVPGLCTRPCATNDECAADRWTAGGRCGPAEAPWCLPPAPGGGTGP